MIAARSFMHCRQSRFRLSPDQYSLAFEMAMSERLQMQKIRTENSGKPNFKYFHPSSTCKKLIFAVGVVSLQVSEKPPYYSLKSISSFSLDENVSCKTLYLKKTIP